MATCISCKQGGIFSSTNPRTHLCKTCHANFAFSMQQYFDLRDRHLEVIGKTKKASTKIARYEDLLDNFQRMMEVNDQFNQGFREEFEEDYRLYQSIMEDTVKKEMFRSVKKHMEKAEVAHTLSTKISSASRAVIELNEALDRYPDDSNLARELIFVKQFIHKEKYSDLLDRAKKEEFKGNTKRALDRYKDVLYFLRTDDVPDEHQEEEISSIEKKIAELEAGP